MSQCFFKRYETKYILETEQYVKIMDTIKKYTVPDEYCRTDVCSIYFDTPDYRVIRTSIEKPVYKEKLRIRCYGIPSETGRGFLEIKKKYKGVVYKRRIETGYDNCLNYIYGLGDMIPESQIKSEIRYFMDFYSPLAPKADIFYRRYALCDRSDRRIRFTFDTDVFFRDYDFDIKNGIYGSRILPQNKVIMEIKSPGAMPLWTSEMLSREGIFPASFSKYGEAYNKFILKKSYGRY